MRAYSPSHVDPRVQTAVLERGDLVPSSDSEIQAYWQAYWASFLRTLDDYFADQVQHVGLSTFAPYETKVLRLGGHGVVVGHRPADSFSVSLLSPQDFDPPIESTNIFEIQERLEAPLVSFSFAPTEYSAETGRLEGIRIAFREALELFWSVTPPQDFEGLATELLKDAGVVLLAGPDEGLEHKLDSAGTVFLDEPASFVREGRWAFEFKHHKLGRPSASLIRELERKIEEELQDYDVICLLTSGDVTSFASHVSVGNPQVRIWDRNVLNTLLHDSPEILQRYFQSYAEALDRVVQAEQVRTSNHAHLEARLQGIRPGREQFAVFEELIEDQIATIFPEALGTPQSQVRTEDGVERRDIITRNNRVGRFFSRIADRADFLIWDCKNHTDPIGGGIVRDVAAYASKALGRFIVIVSRKGAGTSALAAQVREFREDERIVLVIGDSDLLEMARRAEDDTGPEGVLEDALDQLLMSV